MQSVYCPLSLRFCIALACIVLLAAPSMAFTAQSMTITVEKSGDATAVFRYTLEGFIENSIPESVLQDEVVKGLSTSSEPPEVLAFDKSGATLRMKQFATLSDTPTGTEYLTGSINFSKAEDALKQSSLSSMISADFSPQTATVTFPDGYKEEFSNVAVLPSIRHVVIDPTKHGDMMTTTAGTQYGTAMSTAEQTPAVKATPAGAAPVQSFGGDEGFPLVPVILVVIVLIAIAGAGAYYYTVIRKK